MENTKEEEEEKLHYTTLNYKMKMKLLLKLCMFLLWNPKGVFIGIRGTGGQGTNPGPKRAARRAPRPYGCGNAAWAAFSRPLGGRARDASRRARSFRSPVRFCFQFLIFGPWF